MVRTRCVRWFWLGCRSVSTTAARNEKQEIMTKKEESFERMKCASLCASKKKEGSSGYMRVLMVQYCDGKPIGICKIYHNTRIVMYFDVFFAYSNGLPSQYCHH